MNNENLIFMTNIIKKKIDLNINDLSNFYLLYTIAFCSNYIELKFWTEEKEKLDFSSLKQEAILKINKKIFLEFNELDPNLEFYANLIKDYNPVYTHSDPLGTIYMICSEKNKVKKLGEHYTRNDLVEFILEEIDEPKLYSKKILDPACGSGNFLIRILSQALQNKSQKYIKKIIVNLEENRFIIGTDIQAIPCLITKLRILMEILHHTKFLDPFMKLPVFQLNSLLENSDILSEGSFDLVITNPPYLRYHSIELDDRIKLKESFISAIGRFDIYALFIEKSLKLVKPEGTVAVLCSDKFMLTDYGKGIREFVENNATLLRAYNLEEIFPFKAAVLSGVYIFKKSILVQKPLWFKVKLNNNKLFKNKVGTIAIERTWRYIGNETEHILEAIKTKGIVPLGSITECISLGIQTTADNVFCKNITNKFVEEYGLEDSLIYPLLRGKNLNKWTYDWSGNCNNKDTNILYPYENSKGNSISINLKKYPNVEKHLLENKQELSNRTYIQESVSKVWYDHWNSRSFSLFEGPKIITPEISSHNSFSLDTKGYFYNGTVYGIKLKKNFKIEDYKYILGILNSNLLTFYHKNKNQIQLKSKKYRFKSPIIREYPIKMLNNDDPFYNKIVDIVDLILLSQENIIANEKKLNEIIYAIYNIDKKDQMFIENSL